MSALRSASRADAALAAEPTRVLFEKYSNRILAYCMSRLGSREEAEDATQTTFLNAFRSLQSGVVPQFELAWLFRIAENVCRDGHKSASRRRRVEAPRDLQDVQDIVSAPPRSDEGLVGLDEALAAMPDRQRQALLLREWRGFSYGEIAAELGLSNAAVETLIFRARRALARGLQAPGLRRRASGFNLLSLLGTAKSVVQGGAAAKLAATAIAVGGAAVVVSVPLGDSRQASRQQDTRPPAVSPVDSTPAPAAADATTRVAPSPDLRRRQPRPSFSTREAPIGAAPAAAAPVTRDATPSSVPSRAGAQPPGAAPAASADGNLPTPTPPPASPQAPVASAPALPPPPVASPPAPPPPVAPEVPGLPEPPPVVPSTPPLAPPPLPSLPETPPLDLPGLPPLPPLP